MRIALLISGSGSTAQAIINAAKFGKLQNLVTPAIVISSNPNAPGLAKAQELQVQTAVIEKRQYNEQKDFGNALLAELSQHHVDLISQNGWLPLLPKNVIDQFNGKIINQHLGPLDPGFPDFGGKGMYGARVMCARLIYCILTEEEFPWTEATVHYVTEEFDKGALIAVREFPFEKIDRRMTKKDIEENTSVQEFIKNKTKQLQKELLPLEHATVIEALFLLAQGKHPSFVREERLIPDENVPILLFAKKMAIQLFPEG